MIFITSKPWFKSYTQINLEQFLEQSRTVKIKKINRWGVIAFVALLIIIVVDSIVQVKILTDSFNGPTIFYSIQNFMSCHSLLELHSLASF